MAGRWQQHIAEQVQRFGGVLLPGVPFLHVVAFGLPLTLDQMPQRAVQAALAIRHQVAEAARTRGAEPCPEVRLAVHVGEVLADVSDATPAQGHVEGQGISTPGCVEILCRKARAMGHKRQGLLGRCWHWERRWHWPCSC